MERAFLPALILLFLSWPAGAGAEGMIPPRHRIVDGEILVTARLDGLPERIRTEIGDGIPKRLEFSIELIRQWDNWLDEYIDGVTIVRTIKYDVTKKQYELSSREGRYLYEKSTSDTEAAFRWLTRLDDVPLARVSGLPGGVYYVQVRVEARRIQLPALLKVILFFVPEIEYSSLARGEPFAVGE